MKALVLRTDVTMKSTKVRYIQHFYCCTVHLDIINVLHLPTDALYISLINNKISFKTYIKIAPTCFGLRPSSGSLQLSMLPHHPIVHNDVLLPTIFINVTLTRLKCKLPDDGRRPKHVVAILMVW